MSKLQELVDSFITGLVYHWDYKWREEDQDIGIYRDRKAVELQKQFEGLWIVRL